MTRLRLPTALALLFLVILAIGCGGAKKETPLLESEKKLAGMYEACKTIKLVDSGATRTIQTDPLGSLPQKEVSAILKRSNGMTIPGTWSGVSLSTVLDAQGVARPFKELKIEAWDGYVGRVGYDIAVLPDTILALTQNQKPIPREDGPVRLVVASQDGFYWIRMLTAIEVLR